MPEKAEKEYEKAAKEFEKAATTARLVEEKIADLNKKIAKGMDNRSLEKALVTVEKHVKDLHTLGEKQDKAHKIMEKSLEKLCKEKNIK